MNINLLSADFKIRKLDKNDVDIIYNLSSKNKIFYQYHPPFVTKESIEEDIEALPPNKSVKDKYYMGFFDNEILVAVMDLILSYPVEDTAFIGLFIMNVEYQNKGIGSNIIDDVCNRLKKIGFSKIRISVDKGNPQSNNFWIKNSFHIISENKYIIMERELWIAGLGVAV